MGRAATLAVGGTVAAAAVAKAGAGIAAAPAAADGGPYRTYYDVGVAPHEGYFFQKSTAGSGCPPGFGQVNYVNTVGAGFLGGCVTAFDVGENLDGRLEVFGLGTNGVIYHDWMTLPATNPGELNYTGGAWSGWYSLGTVGSGFTNGPEADSPGITGGMMKVHAWDARDNVYVRYRPNSSWSAWSELCCGY